MTKLLTPLFYLSPLLVLSGCGGDSESQPQADKTPKVAIHAETQSRKTAISNISQTQHAKIKSDTNAYTNNAQNLKASIQQPILVEPNPMTSHNEDVSGSKIENNAQKPTSQAISSDVTVAAPKRQPDLPVESPESHPDIQAELPTRAPQPHTPPEFSERKIHHPEPNTNQPVIVVDDKTQMPDKRAKLTGQLMQAGDKVYEASWQQNGYQLGNKCSLSGNRSRCELDLADPNLYINIKQPINFCLENGQCAHFQPASVSFTGELNYKNQVTAHLTGFSNDIETAWYIDYHSEINAFFGWEHPVSNTDNPLTINLIGNSDTPHSVIHDYLYFCITDKGHGWQRQCFNVGAEAGNIEGFDDLLNSREESNNRLVGGEQINDIPVRTIGPEPYFSGKTRWGTFKLFRPLTPQELYQMGVKLNMAVIYNKDRLYPEMNYDNKHQERMESNFTTVNNAQQLCSQFGTNVPSIDMLMNKYGEYFDFKAAGWPEELYWSRTHNYNDHKLNYHWMYVSYQNKKSDYFDDYMGVTTCARED
ncbi:hypothetical protein NFHSH190041_17540 [Shewanella sp. NFH-SH190041]|nr:hypothetical protein NFHSH190041_17540 [Shewanella sp. NFH-SH190041]